MITSGNYSNYSNFTQILLKLLQVIILTPLPHNTVKHMEENI
jgi:hypothetical protein